MLDLGSWRNDAQIYCQIACSNKKRQNETGADRCSDDLGLSISNTLDFIGQ